MTLKGDGVTFDGKYLANGATSAADFSDMGENRAAYRELQLSLIKENTCFSLGEELW